MHWADFKLPHFAKFQVRALLDLIAGGDKNQLTVKQFQTWHDLIMYAVRDMRSHYKDRASHPNSVSWAYYAPCWKQIERAKSDEEMVAALKSLRDSINME